MTLLQVVKMLKNTVMSHPDWSEYELLLPSGERIAPSIVINEERKEIRIGIRQER